VRDDPICRVRTTHRDLFPQELSVLLAVLKTLLGLAQPLDQQRLRLVRRVRQHDVCAEPDVHLVGGRHLGLGEQRVVELEGGLDRVRLVLVLLSAGPPPFMENLKHGQGRRPGVVTYRPRLQELDRLQRLLDVWYLVFQARGFPLHV